MNSSENGCQCSEILSPGASVATPMKPDWEPTDLGLISVRTSPPRRVSECVSSALITFASPTGSVGGSFCQLTATLAPFGAADLEHMRARRALSRNGVQALH